MMVLYTHNRQILNQLQTGSILPAILLPVVYQMLPETNRFVIYASATGDLYFDVVTVMPPTWKNRPNGLRPDLAEKLDALKFKYIQFPGGCTAESASMDTCWNWKNSIGPLEQRPGSTRNRWGYKNDLYFGLDEYLQLCEDLGAEPVYTTSAGISERPRIERVVMCLSA